MNQPITIIKVKRDPRQSIEESTQQLIELILRSLVAHPEDIKVRYTRGEKTTIFHIDCTKRVIGHILGSKGRTIDGLRSIITAVCGKSGFRAIIEVPYFPADR